jgi:hypothetical protein
VQTAFFYHTMSTAHHCCTSRHIITSQYCTAEHVPHPIVLLHSALRCTSACRGCNRRDLGYGQGGRSGKGERGMDGGLG